MIAGQVRRVAGTKLFVMPSSDGRRQITVYSNKVDTPGANVMCLPVPNPDTIVFETVYDDLFDDCKKSFSSNRGGYQSASLSFGVTNSESRVSYLPVQSHGSYDVVVVPTLDDLDRVPPGFLTLSDDIKSYIRSNYSGGASPFGVLLCKLRAGAVEYEPFAYSHALLSSGELFVPTRHYHIESPGNTDAHRMGPWADGGRIDFTMGIGHAPFDGGISPWLAEANRKMNMMIARSTRSSGVADDWDHEIYTALTPMDAHTVSWMRPKATNTIDWTKMPAEYRFGADYPLRCFERIGTGPNEDLTFPISAAA